MALATEMMAGGCSAGQAKAINGQFASAVSAAGTTLGTATALTASNNIVTTVAANSGVALQNTELGDEIIVYNGTGTNSLTVYPPTSSGTINQLTAGTGMLLPPYTACKFKKFTSVIWLAWLSA